MIFIFFTNFICLFLALLIHPGCALLSWLRCVCWAFHRSGSSCFRVLGSKAHGLQEAQCGDSGTRAPGRYSIDSIVVAMGLKALRCVGILIRIKPRSPLVLEVDSLPLSHQEAPCFCFMFVFFLTLPHGMIFCSD